jgi:8-oxo-dGTP pyrophosphatase MutT (NUDIX family)
MEGCAARGGIETVSSSYPQVIPRPERWEHGAPAPWAHLPVGERRGLTLERVLAALEAQGLLGVPDKPGSPSSGSQVVDRADVTGGAPRHSSVLVALFEEEGEARVVLTRRSAHLRIHKREVSFPGGRMDDGERPVETALREAAEEISLDPSAARVVGHLRPVFTFASGGVIQPVVALLGERPALEAAPDEVERVFDVALSELLAEEVFHEERWHRPQPTEAGHDVFALWFFEISGEMIWGATGRLLVDLLVTVLGVDHQPQS